MEGLNDEVDIQGFLDRVLYAIYPDEDAKRLYSKAI